jgi:hypothetical protein
MRERARGSPSLGGRPFPNNETKAEKARHLKNGTARTVRELTYNPVFQALRYQEIRPPLSRFASEWPGRPGLIRFIHRHDTCGSFQVAEPLERSTPKSVIGPGLRPPSLYPESRIIRGGHNSGLQHVLTETNLAVGRLEPFVAGGGYGARHRRPSDRGLRSQSVVSRTFLTICHSFLPVPSDRQGPQDIPGCCAGSPLQWPLGRALSDARTSISVLQGKSAHSAGNWTSRCRFPIFPSDSGKGCPRQDS